jgi:hypothetical protein
MTILGPVAQAQDDSAKRLLKTMSDYARSQKDILPGPQGPLYSTQLQCFNPADRMRKKVSSNLIIRPDRVNQISIGPEFSGLKI